MAINALRVQACYLCLGFSQSSLVTLSWFSVYAAALAILENSIIPLISVEQHAEASYQVMA